MRGCGVVPIDVALACAEADGESHENKRTPTDLLKLANCKVDLPDLLSLSLSAGPTTNAVNLACTQLPAPIQDEDLDDESSDKQDARYCSSLAPAIHSR
jgi:hypothetical protein